MLIIDSFTFYNEVELLFYRLTMLYPVVDYFIIVEATKTHAGNQKPLFFQDNREKFEPFMDKIIHIIDNELLDIGCDAWYNENHQRNKITEGIDYLHQKYNLSDNDLIMISDVDEIPDYKFIEKIRAYNIPITIAECEMDLYYYNLTCKHVNKWYNFKIVSYKTFIEQFNKSPQMCRTPPANIIQAILLKNAGWHLSYFGDVRKIRNKLQQFAHQEYNNEQYTNLNNIAERIALGDDLFGRKQDIIEKIPLNENNNLPHEYLTYFSNFLG